MITKTSTGVCIEGRLVFDPEVRAAGQKTVYKMLVRAHSVKTDAGTYNNTDVECCVWRDFDWLDGMLQKGDHVTVYAREVTKREHNGKIYFSANVDAGEISGPLAVVFRWLQNVIDIVMNERPAPEPEPVNEPTPFDAKPDVPPPAPAPVQTTLEGAQLYPGESLSDYAPGRKSAPPPDPGRPIADDEDLPF